VNVVPTPRKQARHPHQHARFVTQEGGKDVFHGALRLKDCRDAVPKVNSWVSKSTVLDGVFLKARSRLAAFTISP
jgi:hypothetical protein